MLNKKKQKDITFFSEGVSVFDWSEGMAECRRRQDRAIARITINSQGLGLSLVSNKRNPRWVCRDRNWGCSQ